MNTIFFLIATLSLAGLSTCVTAQNKPASFSGTWVLDVPASKLQDFDQRIESLTLKIVQTTNDIEIANALKLVPPNPAYMGGPVVQPLEQNFTNKYKLDGTQSEGQVESIVGPRPATLKAKLDGAKLQLWQINVGDPALNFDEVWTLSKDGKTLTVERHGPFGRNSKLVFNKKQ